MRLTGTRTRLKAVASRRNGAAAVEFGIVGSAFCLLLFGVFEVSRYYFAYDAVRTILAEAARLAQIDSNFGADATQPCKTGTSIDSRVRQRTPLDPTGLTVCSTRSVTGTVTTVVVSASYSFQFVSIPMLTRYLGSTSRTISETTRTVF